MNVVITGAGGYIGSTLARNLALSGVLADDTGKETPIHRLMLLDKVPLNAPAGDVEVVTARGDIADAGIAAKFIGSETEVVFHLSGVVSGAAEADFALGMRANLDGTRQVLEACRAAGRPVRLVYSSSIAVFGTPLPSAIRDDTPTRPTLSYGAQKLACEILLDDYSRRGYVDGRALRLPGIVVRPPLANGALSGFNSDLLREPLAGRSYTVPVGPDAVIWLMSIDRCVANLMNAAALPADAWKARRALNLPCIAVRVGDIVSAMSRIRGTDLQALVRYARDPKLEAQFGAWPLDFVAERALELGFVADPSIDAIIRAYLDTSP